MIPDVFVVNDVAMRFSIVIIIVPLGARSSSISSTSSHKHGIYPLDAQTNCCFIQSGTKLSVSGSSACGSSGSGGVVVVVCAVAALVCCVVVLSLCCISCCAEVTGESPETAGGRCRRRESRTYTQAARLWRCFLTYNSPFTNAFFLKRGLIFSALPPL